LFFDPRKRIIGAAHSGREGTRKNISRQTILLMQKLGANPADIKAAIGPGITAPNYPVDEDTWQNFCTSTAVSQRFPFLDLRKVLYRQLINAGIKNHNIFNLSYCTFSDPFYYSWRQNKTKNRQFSWVMLR
jgi:copper oxidase (laccase) domain-containing protein